jgi:hypothetical protein
VSAHAALRRIAPADAEAERFSPAAIVRVMAFDVATVIREAEAAAARLTPEERERHWKALEKARFDAAEYALASDDSELRELAIRFLTRYEGRAA